MTAPDYQRLAVEHRDAIALHAAKLREYARRPAPDRPRLSARGARRSVRATRRRWPRG